MSTLESKVALVTGSSSGIGAATAIAFAQRGASVILHGRSESRNLMAVRESVLEFEVECDFVASDFESWKDPEKDAATLLDAAYDKFGRLDFLINNAGGDVLTGSKQSWDLGKKLDYLFKVDVKATFALSKRFGELANSNGGDSTANGGQDQKATSCIVNIGWDQAWQGMAGDSGELFSATKGSIMSMSLSLAQSLAPHVRVNCVAPGWIKTAWGQSTTEQWDQRAKNESLLQRWGTPKDVANVVVFLCGSESSFVNGQVIAVNGGFNYFNTRKI